VPGCEPAVECAEALADKVTELVWYLGSKLVHLLYTYSNTH
jgi:hypothetical protein